MFKVIIVGDTRQLGPRDTLGGDLTKLQETAMMERKYQEAIYVSLSTCYRFHPDLMPIGGHFYENRLVCAIPAAARETLKPQLNRLMQGKPYRGISIKGLVTGTRDTINNTEIENVQRVVQDLVQVGISLEDIMVRDDWWRWLSEKLVWMGVKKVCD